jgi:EmrB/QacA subfamily drug resistance transporter
LDSETRRVLPWLVAVAFFMQTLDSTILNTALPSMARSLGESPLRMQSVVVSYMLTVALLIPASGFLADRFGTRRVFAAAIVVFTLGSVTCAASRTLTELVLARVLQGVGGSLLLPVGRLTILKSVPRSELLSVLSFVTIPGLIGPLIGPTLGGLLVETLSWHWIFLINVPIGILGTFLGLKYMPEIREERTRFDWLGFVLVAVGMVGISVSLESFAEGSMAKGSTTITLVLGLAAFAAYVLHQTRIPTPLFHPGLWRIHSFSVGLAGNLFARLGSGAMPYLSPLFLQVGLGKPPTVAGMFMAFAVLGAMGSKMVVEKLVARLGYRRFLLTNTALLGLTMMGFAWLPEDVSAARLAAHLFLFGVFNSLQFSSMNTLTLSELDGETASSGNSLLSMIMQLSMSFGVASGAAILSAFARGDAARASVQEVSVLHAFQNTYICVGLLALLSSLVFWQLSEKDGAPASAEGPPSEL